LIKKAKNFAVNKHRRVKKKKKRTDSIAMVVFMAQNEAKEKRRGVEMKKCALYPYTTNHTTDECTELKRMLEQKAS